MERDMARAIEKLLFPSNTIIIGAILLLIYLRGEPVFISNVLTFLSSLLVYGLVIYLFKERVRDENKLYCIGALSALSIFFLCYWFLKLSKEIVFGAISLLLVTLVIYTVRPRWNISGHTTALMGVWTTLLLVDLVFLPLGVLSPLAIWSRLKLKAHTPTQIIAGAMVGSSVPLMLHYFFI